MCHSLTCTQYKSLQFDFYPYHSAETHLAKINLAVFILTLHVHFALLMILTTQLSFLLDSVVPVSYFFPTITLVTPSQCTSQLFFLSPSLKCVPQRSDFSFISFTLLYAPLVIFIYFHGFIYHLYGEGAQIYISDPNLCSQCHSCLSTIY